MDANDPVDGLITAALPEVRSWSGRPEAAALAELPNTPAVLLLVDAVGRPVQLLTAQQLRRCVRARLTESPTAGRGRADLTTIVGGVRWRHVACPFEARWWYWRLARRLYPEAYRKLVSFGSAWFLNVDWTQPVPELRVTERVWELPGAFVGPWPARSDAQRALEGLWDLFDLCRHPEQIRKAPRGRRCAYAEMGRCDAPCDGSAPLAAYIARCRTAWEFATGGSAAWLADAEQRMRAAAAAQEYERAGQIKQQVRCARLWEGKWAAHVRPAEALTALLVLPVTRRKAWLLMLFRQGHLQAGPVVPARQFPAAAVAWLETAWAEPAGPTTATERMEQTWLVAHLLFGREAASTLVYWLPAAGPPAGTEADLAARAAALRPPPMAERPEDADHAVWRETDSSAEAEASIPSDESGGCDAGAV